MKTVAVSLNVPIFDPKFMRLSRTWKFSSPSTVSSLMSVILNTVPLVPSLIVRSSFRGKKSMPAIERS